MSCTEEIRENKYRGNLVCENDFRVEPDYLGGGMMSRLVTYDDDEDKAGRRKEVTPSPRSLLPPSSPMQTPWRCQPRYIGPGDK